MGWDGNGAFSRTNGAGQTGATTWADSDTAGHDIVTSEHDTHDEDLAQGIAACLTKNGETKATADFRPNADNTFSLGSTALRWINAWLSGTVKFKQTSFAGTLQATTLTANRTYTLPDADAGLIPSGSVTAFAGSSAPDGWLLCNGAAVSRTTYATLFGVISTTYGVGDGSTTFNVPDCTGRAIFGKEASETRITTAISGVNGGTLGASGGSQALHSHTHTGTTTSDGDHTHTINSATAGAGGNAFTADAPLFSTITTSSAGAHTHTFTSTSTGAGSSQNLPPAIVLNYIVKY